MTTSISDRVANRVFEIYRETDWIQDIQIATSGGSAIDILNGSPGLASGGISGLLKMWVKLIRMNGQTKDVVGAMDFDYSDMYGGYQCRKA